MRVKTTIAALVAAMALSAPALAGETYYNWSGLYLGAHAGYAWGNASVKDTTGGVLPGPFDYSPKGALGGGTVGLNWQAGNIVFGVEGDLGAMGLSGTGIAPSSNPIYHQDLTLDSGMYGVAAGRLGFALGRTLIYGKGGFAFYDGEAGQKTTKPGYVTHGTDTFTGWAYGGGVEQSLGQGWSVKAEYLHFDFGSQGGDQTSISDPPIGFVYRNETDVTADSVQVGVNYRWGDRDDINPLK